MAKDKKTKKPKADPKKTSRTSVDDEVNDIHDDDFFDEDSGLSKENDPDKFEKPW